LSSLLKHIKFIRVVLPKFKMSSALVMIKYSLASGVGIIIDAIQQRAEVIILALLLGTGEVAIFNIGVSLAAVILIPTRSIAPMAITVVAQSWTSGDIGRIQRVYSASAINQLILSGLIFIAIIGAIPLIDMILPETFKDYRQVLLLLGFAKLANVSFGINGSIINVSSFYRIGLVINGLLAFTTIGGMFLLIPIYGKEGAAFVSFAGIMLINVIRSICLKYKFGLRLISRSYVHAILVTLLSIAITSYFLLKFNSIFISIPISAAMILINLWVAFKNEWSQDLNKMILDLKDEVLTRLKRL